MIPDASLTLDAVRVSQGTHAGMSAQTFPTVTNPGFTEVTHCPLEDKRRITEQKDFCVFFSILNAYMKQIQQLQFNATAHKKI